MACPGGEDLGEFRRSLSHSSRLHHDPEQLQEVCDGEGVFLGGW